jgi:hypothetical protein
MQQMPSLEHLQEKWAPLLDYEGLDPIKDSYCSTPGEPRDRTP